MAPWQKISIAVLLIVLVTVMVTTWGSVGSAAIGLALLMAGAALLYQHFLNRDDPYDYQDD